MFNFNVIMFFAIVCLILLGMQALLSVLAQTQKFHLPKIVAPIAMLILVAASTIGAIHISNEKSIIFGINFAKLWMIICFHLLGILTILLLLKLWKKHNLTKAISVISVLALITGVSSTAVYYNDHQIDSWFYTLRDDLTEQYSNIDHVELGLGGMAVYIYIECNHLDLPDESDRIIKDIKEKLRIGDENIFQDSYKKRDKGKKNSDNTWDLDFVVTFFVDDSEIEYATGYLANWDHTETKIVDNYQTWSRLYNDNFDYAYTDQWFDN